MAHTPAAHDHAKVTPPPALPESSIVLFTTGVQPDRPVEVGGMVSAVVVNAANVVRDIRENIRNLIGGRMVHYERLIQTAVDTALAELQAKARAAGYDGVVGVRISHPTVVDGGVEVIVYGNGFRWKHAPGDGQESQTELSSSG